MSKIVPSNPSDWISSSVPKSINQSLSNAAVWKYMPGEGFREKRWAGEGMAGLGQAWRTMTLLPIITCCNIILSTY